MDHHAGAVHESPASSTVLVSSVSGAIAELRFACEQVPFFGEYLRDAGLDPSDIRTAGDFRRVPATTKADYRRHFPAGVLAQGTSVNDPFVFRSRSSGTAGDRLTTVAYTFSLAERLLATSEVNPALFTLFGSAEPVRACRYAPPNCSDVECAVPATTRQSRTMPDGTLVLPVAHDLLATPDSMVTQAIDEFIENQPHWLYADPHHLAFLVRNLQARGVPPPAGCSAIVLTYSLVSAVARRQIARYFRPATVIAEVCSMSELGWIGMECPAGYVHLNAANFYLELLVDGRPAEPGELAELYVTSIGDQICPHIRYRTGDMYVLTAGDCPCGHPFPRAEHHGRRRDVLRRGDAVLLTSRQLDALVGPAEWMLQYQLRQHTEDRFHLRYIPSSGPDAPAAAELVSRLRSGLGSDAQLTAEAVPYLECERSGKFVTCLNEVPA